MGNKWEGKDQTCINNSSAISHPNHSGFKGLCSKSVLCQMHFAEQRLKTVPMDSPVKLCWKLWEIWAGWTPICSLLCRSSPQLSAEPWCCACGRAGIVPPLASSLQLVPSSHPLWCLPNFGSHSSITARLCLFLLWVEVSILLKGSQKYFSLFLLSWENVERKTFPHDRKYNHDDYRVGNSIFSYTISQQATINRWDHR